MPGGSASAPEFGAATTPGADGGVGNAGGAAVGTMPGTAGAVAPVETVEMQPPRATALATEIDALGLDAQALPPLAKLAPKTLRRAMKLFAKSLGAKCTDCHQESDYAAPTRRKKIAAKMWDEFAVKLSLSDGGALFCDSCHHGRFLQLDRSDKKALGRWMDAHFVAELRRRDGKEHGCETCHVNMEMRFLAAWAR
jgi:hypothetical protein